MKRILAPLAVLGALGGLFWFMIVNLQSEPVAGDDLAAIILRAPQGFAVQDLGDSSFRDASALLNSSVDDRTGARFTENGDTVILLADRGNDEMIEMRASRSGTIVERRWEGDIATRLIWAIEHGDLDTPGLAPPTGKNLYH